MNTSRARSFTAWQQSLDLAYGGHVQYGIRSYIQTRIMTAMQQLREGPLPAEISEVSWLPARPAPTEEVLVTCRITDAAGVQAAELLYSVAGGPPTIAAMFDDGRRFFWPYT